ncbi:uncharacterized protein LODBEIA_P52160 [Lodderomyces beijingensis]|uniref:Extracellular membrane protein CFEM domain-containing protein n=1 Tax=Lodderomyces beijingensis TaxID=1775926 RepID=A0ABP0ZSA5_9ASCO
MTLKSVFIASFLLVFALGASLNRLGEYGTYVNPNPRKPSSKCDPKDLAKLSTCCNDVLSKLDECKPDDLACECCALQSIDQECYQLCPGNPNTNFLAVLLSDCSQMSEINACAIPFKKEDPEPPRRSITKVDEDDPRLADDAVDASLQSRVYSGNSLTDRPFKSKKIKLTLNEAEDDAGGADGADDNIFTDTHENSSATRPTQSLVPAPENYSNISNSSYQNLSSFIQAGSAPLESSNLQLWIFLSMAIAFYLFC